MGAVARPLSFWISCSPLRASWAFPTDASGKKKSTCNAGDASLIPGSGRAPGKGNGYTLQYSCLKNPMNRGASWVTVHSVTKNWTRLSDLTLMHTQGFHSGWCRHCMQRFQPKDGFQTPLPCENSKAGPELIKDHPTSPLLLLLFSH